MEGFHTEDLVVISGTSKGIGKAIAEKFLFEGFEVVGFDRKESTINNSKYTHIQQNLDRMSALPDLVRPATIIINNAGTQCESDMVNNFWSAFNLTERYLTGFIRSVLMIASASAITGAEFPEYCASKGAMCAYGKNIAQRIGKYKATCNNLCPGGVYTDINEHIIDNPTMLDQVKKETLVGDWATPEQIAEWAYFLTVTNTFATGQDFLVDGGEHIKSNFIW